MAKTCRIPKGMTAKEYGEQFKLFVKSENIWAIEKLLPKHGTPIENFKGCLESQSLKFKETPIRKHEAKVTGHGKKKTYHPAFTGQTLKIRNVDFWFINGKYDGWGYSFDRKVTG